MKWLIERLTTSVDPHRQPSSGTICLIVFSLILIQHIKISSRFLNFNQDNNQRYHRIILSSFHLINLCISFFVRVKFILHLFLFTLISLIFTAAFKYSMEKYSFIFSCQVVIHLKLDREFYLGNIHLFSH